MANFCAATAAVPPAAAGSGIYRETMTQPGVYWLLDAPFLRIVGLYSNLIENPGYLEGKTPQGAGDLSQIEWLQKTLKAIAADPVKKALIIATHHPPFSAAGHSGSAEMCQTIDQACQDAGLWPDAFLSGHAHNYQRYTRRIGGKQIPYVVGGCGGMPPQPVPPATGQPVGGANGTTYDVADQSYGYLFLTVSKAQLKIEFWQLGEEQVKPFDAVTVDLALHTVS
jgi:hypothetical protein